MKVKRLTMQAFRGIDDLTLEFHPNVTVLVGVNGVGKTRSLTCIAKLLFYLIKDLPGVGSLAAKEGKLARLERSFRDEDITNGADLLHAEISITANSEPVSWSVSTRRREQQSVDDEALASIVEQFNEVVSQQTQDTVITSNILKMAISLGRLQENRPTFKSSSEFQRLAEELRNQAEDVQKGKLPLVVFYPTNRLVSDPSLRSTEKASFNPVDAYTASLSGQTDFKSFFTWFRSREDLENEIRIEDSSYRDIQIESVRKAIVSLQPNLSGLKVGRSPLRMVVTKKVSDKEQELIVNQLSDGEKCLLAMVGDIARRLAIANPGLPDPLQGEGIILIDEIELHLHPQWQRGILPKLSQTFPNCQFIVTTHSPQVISDVQSESVIILESEEGKVVAKYPRNSFGRDSNQILESLMDTPERRKDILDKIQFLFRLIAESKLDEARALQDELSAQIGADEPDLVGARAAIRRREILGR